MGIAKGVAAGAAVLAGAALAGYGLSEIGSGLTGIFNSIDNIKSESTQTLVKTGAAIVGAAAGCAFGVVSGAILGDLVHKKKEFELILPMIAYGAIGLISGGVGGFNYAADHLPPIEAPKQHASHVAYLDTTNPNFIRKLTV